MPMRDFSKIFVEGVGRGGGGEGGEVTISQ